MSAHQANPITFTLDPRLDQAATESATAWESAARAARVDRTAAWLAQRLNDPEGTADLAGSIDRLLAAEDGEELIQARAELAELIEGSDDPLAERLWESIRDYAAEHDDGETLASATAQLAAIAEDQGDLLGAAEHHIAFLNWRRGPGRVSDPEDVQTSFDEVIRLAELDGEPQAAALFAFRQANFTRLVDADDSRTTEGDWESAPGPYGSWS
ncbi:MAG TPA: hypothetical protein VGR08_13015 [Thermomicrobiales bacterium]|nr:hypothetical protein [Thermomicrobiales bacterium]